MSIQTDLTRLQSAKAAIKTAIEGKGVTVPEATLLDGMASLIESIEAGGVGGLDISSIGYQGGVSGSVTFETDSNFAIFSYIGEPAKTFLFYTQDLDALYASSGGTYANKRLYGAFKTVVTNLDNTTTNLLIELDGNYSGESLFIEAGSAITINSSNSFGEGTNRTIRIETKAEGDGTCSVTIQTKNASSGVYSKVASGAMYKWLALW